MILVKLLVNLLHQIRYLKSLTLSVLLHPVGYRKLIIQIHFLEDIKASVNGYLPPSIRDNMAGMDGSGQNVLPREANTHLLYYIHNAVKVTHLLRF